MSSGTESKESKSPKSNSDDQANRSIETQDKKSVFQSKTDVSIDEKLNGNDEQMQNINFIQENQVINSIQNEELKTKEKLEIINYEKNMQYSAESWVYINSSELSFDNNIPRLGI